MQLIIKKQNNKFSLLYFTGNYHKCAQRMHTDIFESNFPDTVPTGKTAVFQLQKIKENWHFLNGISTKFPCVLWSNVIKFKVKYNAPE